MDIKTLIFGLMSLFGWGIGAFISKFATNRIGDKAVFWDVVGYAPAVIIYCLIVFKSKEIFSVDKIGILLAFLSGAIGSLGLIGFYLALTRKDASLVVPLTAMYPILTAILAIVFLKESLTIIKVIGIILSVVALICLSI